jgi:hypothetical protein
MPFDEYWNKIQDYISKYYTPITIYKLNQYNNKINNFLSKMKYIINSLKK